MVRARVSGAPSGMGAFRIRVSGPSVADGTVYFTDGKSGADGEGDVNCRTTDASGAPEETSAFVSCSGVAGAPHGGFFIHMRLAHPHGRSSLVTFTLLPLGLDQGAHDGNDSGELTLR